MILISGSVANVPMKDFLNHVFDARRAIENKIPLAGAGVVGDVVKVTLGTQGDTATITYEAVE